MLESFGIATKMMKFAPPLSRRSTTNRRELQLSRLLPDGPPPPVRCDCCAHFEVVAPLPGTGEDPPAEKTGQRIRSLAETQTISRTGVAGFEWTSAPSLLGRLVLQQIRPHTRSRRGEGVGGASEESPGGYASGLTVHSRLTGPVVRPHGETVLPSVETLFTQLAWRRLHRRAIQETCR